MPDAPRVALPGGHGSTSPAAPRSNPASGQFLSIGELLIDFIVSDGAASLVDAGAFAALPGGAPANVAVALARLGVPSAVAAVTGSDPFGERLTRALVAEGVDTSRVRTSDTETTTFAFAWKDERNDGHFWLLRAADQTLDKRDAEQAAIERVGCVIVGSVSLAAEPSRSCIYRAVGLAVAAGVPVCLDVNYRPTLWQSGEEFAAVVTPVLANATVVKFSLQDAVGLFGGESTPEEAIAKVRDHTTASSIVLTGGETGCWFPDPANGTVHHVPAFVVDAVEPTGAGDAFTAALVQRLATTDWRAAQYSDVAYAAAAGALATTKPGAWSALPTTDELDAFLRRMQPGQ